MSAAAGSLGTTLLVLFGFPAYIVASLGARSLGIPGIVRAALSPPRREPERFLIAVFVLSGPVLTLTPSVTPAGYPEQSEYNLAVWFFVQGKYLAWIFAVEALRSLGRARGRLARALLVGLMLAMSVPSTFQYFGSIARDRLDRFPPELIEALRFLEAESAPGEVVFAPERLARGVVSLTHCRAAVLTVFPSSFVSLEELQRRRREQRAFWRSWAAGALRGDVLARYRSRLVLVEHGHAHPSLEPLFTNQGFAIYRLPGPRERAGPMG